MSLSDLFKKKSTGSYDAKIDQRGQELLGAVQRDLDILKNRANGQGGWFGKKTTGQYNEESGHLVYPLFSGDTEHSASFDVRNNQVQAITAAVRKAIGTSQALKDVHDFCARDDIDLRIEHLLRDDFVPNITGNSYRTVTATVEVRTHEKYRASSQRLARPPAPKPVTPPPTAPLSAKERLAAHIETLSAAETEELLAALTGKKQPVEIQPAPADTNGLRTVRAPRIVIQKRTTPAVKKP